MKFQVGDRVLMVEIEDTGTIDLIKQDKDYSIRIIPDNPDKFFPKEKNKPKPNTNTDVRYWCKEEHLELLCSGRRDPDWKDIWDESAT